MAQTETITALSRPISTPVTKLTAPAVLTTVEWITPEIAQSLLENNAGNRPINANQVQRFAKDMLAGRWEYNGQDILISSTGRLLDGQHRLEAVVAADIPVYMGVKRGLPESVFTTLDAGAPRKAAHILAIEGMPQPVVMAAAGRYALAYIKGVGFSGGRNQIVTRREITDFILENKDRFLDAVHLARRLKNRVPAGPAAGVLFLANQSGTKTEKLEEFIQGTFDGVGLTRGDPRHTLREWAFNERARNRGHLPSEIAFAGFSRAWTAFARDEQLLLIKMPQTISKATVYIEGYQDDQPFAS